MFVYRNPNHVRKSEWTLRKANTLKFIAMREQLRDIYNTDVAEGIVVSRALVQHNTRVTHAKLHTSRHVCDTM